ncbi:hypothetical protein FB45DRAFT_78492 [Roridomyces roridus]|uniref:Uncharacterized protein n=1 Tax=Roridomyces roridus TaxID=1738132 RepID=A0AAD7AY58_9AGAR|nr:hypothetical protein FB45DRAFT_78492 [Roridomyces roridus]
MATDNPGSLVLYSSSATQLSPDRDKSKWDLAFNFTPSPGRTLNEMYTAGGKFLDTRANRFAHQCGLGPNSVAEAIRASFGERGERHTHLARLQTEVPPKLEKNVAKLMKYTLPTESAKTQIQAFRAIVDLSTSFPGLRSVFLASRSINDVSRTQQDISALWDRNDECPTDDEWTFWRAFAATCLSDKAIAPILEGHAIARLTSCVMDDGGLSVIERLIIAHDCETESLFLAALSLWYIAGVLDLPGFWDEMATVHRDVAKKLCTTLVQILKDIDCDCLPSEIAPSQLPPVDYEGIDLFADRILLGVSGWFVKLDADVWNRQRWYEDFRRGLQLLRGLLSYYRSPSPAPPANPLKSTCLQSFVPLRWIF